MTPTTACTCCLYLIVQSPSPSVCLSPSICLSVCLSVCLSYSLSLSYSVSISLLSAFIPIDLSPMNILALTLISIIVSHLSLTITFHAMRPHDLFLSLSLSTGAADFIEGRRGGSQPHSGLPHIHHGSLVEPWYGYLCSFLLCFYLLCSALLCSALLYSSLLQCTLLCTALPCTALFSTQLPSFSATTYSPLTCII